jgi:hypothetical protein
MPLNVVLPNGRKGDPQSGITPIMAQLEPGHYQVVGTGFYIARYGLFVTAKHVVDELHKFDRQGRPCVAWNWTSSGQLFIRPIHTCSFLTDAPYRAADLAVCQAVASCSNGNIEFDSPNERLALTALIPAAGAHTGTYAYPGNLSVDFRNEGRVGRIFADVFEGRVLGTIGATERQLRYEHVDTSIRLKGGASGGPVFSHDGHAFAVNCLSWDFGEESGLSPLSSVVPVSHFFDVPFKMPLMPAGSAEATMVPEKHRDNKDTTLRELASWGHIVIHGAPAKA